VIPTNEHHKIYCTVIKMLNLLLEFSWQVTSSTKVLPVYSAKLGLFYDIGNHQNVRKKHSRNTNAFHAFSKSSLDG
jgi:hypothetical protein